MGELVTLAERLPRDHIPRGIDIIATRMTSGFWFNVHCSWSDDEMRLIDNRRFTSVTKALAYAAALSAKHEAPIYPHGHAEQMVAEFLKA